MEGESPGYQEVQNGGASPPSLFLANIEYFHVRGLCGALDPSREQEGARKGLSKEMATRKASSVGIWRERIPGRGAARAKALRQEKTWCVHGVEGPARWSRLMGAGQEARLQKSAGAAFWALWAR